jgi:hypothetical protein
VRPFARDQPAPRPGAEEKRCSGDIGAADRRRRHTLAAALRPRIIARAQRRFGWRGRSITGRLAHHRAIALDCFEKPLSTPPFWIVFPQISEGLLLLDALRC